MDNISLKSRNGEFFIVFNDEWILISEEEARSVMADHSLVYDIIVAHRRKFNFSTAEDRADEGNPVV
ncbi:MAG: hypothetical protein J5825_04905 [Lachnospiraceae bacterium]|nr:hypothetical protein [Lachnospiraceae bacterium]